MDTVKSLRWEDTGRSQESQLEVGGTCTFHPPRGRKGRAERGATAQRGAESSGLADKPAAPNRVQKRVGDSNSVTNAAPLPLRAPQVVVGSVGVTILPVRSHPRF